MIELVGAHRLDETNFVSVRCDMRQAVGNPLSALSGLLEGILRTKKFGHATDEGEALACQKRCRAILPVEPFQFWLVVVKLQLTRRPCHVQVKHAPDFWRELRWQLRQGGGWIAS